jgi:stage II sporulation protein P
VNTTRNRPLVAGLIIVLVIGAGVYAYFNMDRTRAATGETPLGSDERRGSYYTVIDESGRTVFTTGHMLYVGDEFIGEDDTRYQITRVDGDTATAKAVGKMEALPLIPMISAQSEKGSGKVAIYHTHSSESYVPSDGAESRPGAGGILQVGKSMANSIEKRGVQAVHNTTSHEPHDAASYDRSRRTAVKLLKERPMALFDVHRDAGPAEPYLKELDGREVAKAMIVIGRTNPKMNANLDFARRLKDAVNAEYPGLIKGIFMGKADFNQDLFDRALLLEMGTEKTTKEAAEAGAALIGSVVPKVIGATTGAPSGRAFGRSLGWILGLAVAGTFVYLWVATGSWDEMRAKIMGWFGSGGVRIGGRRGGSGDGNGPDGGGSFGDGNEPSGGGSCGDGNGPDDGGGSGGQTG